MKREEIERIAEIQKQLRRENQTAEREEERKKAQRQKDKEESIGKVDQMRREAQEKSRLFEQMQNQTRKIQEEISQAEMAIQDRKRQTEELKQTQRQLEEDNSRNISALEQLESEVSEPITEIELELSRQQEFKADRGEFQAKRRKRRAIQLRMKDQCIAEAAESIRLIKSDTIRQRQIDKVREILAAAPQRHQKTE